MAPESAPGLNVGVVTGVGRSSDAAPRMGQIESKSGAKWLREWFDWSMIEPQNGTYDFSHYDTLMTLASQNGVHVVAELFSTPRWAGATATTVPDDPTAFASFVARVVARYGPHGSFWASHPTLAKMPVKTFELWNEPYYSNGNNGDYNPGRYARLVKAAGAAGHAADPSAKFLLAAENQSALVSSSLGLVGRRAVPGGARSQQLLRRCRRPPLRDRPHRVDLPHPGPGLQGLQTRSAESNRSTTNSSITAPPASRCGSPRSGGQHARMAAACAARRLPARPATSKRCLRTRTIWKSFVRAVFVYGYQDNNPNTADPENDYGLVDYNGTPKPALAVFKANR